MERSRSMESTVTKVEIGGGGNGKSWQDGKM